MRFSASTYYLASLLATLVLVTTSLPTNEHLSDPFNHHPLKGCHRIGFKKYQTDIGRNLVKRDSQSSGTPARALEPRGKGLLCGQIPSDGQSATFRFVNSIPVKLEWTAGGHYLSSQVIGIKKVNLDGRDLVVETFHARQKWYEFKPEAGAYYYIVWGASSDTVLTWFFLIPS